MFIARVAALFLLGFAVLAGAQTSPPDLTRCADTDADTSITACTAFIGSAGQPDPDLAKALTYRGFSYLKKNQFDPAIQDFTKAIQLDPDNAWALANRGNAYFNKRQYDLAMHDYDESLKLNPAGYATLFYGRGAILLTHGDSDHAIEQFSQAISLQPEFPEALNNRGIAFFNNGQFSHAIEDYGKALQLRPNYLSALVNRGNAYAAKNQYDSAIKDYDKAIELQPAPAAYRNRGNAYRADGNFDKAISDLNASLRLQQSTGALDDRGDTYLELGQSARALQDFSEAVRAQPDDPDAFQARGRAEFDLGQWDGAITDFQKSLALDPSNPYAFIWLRLANARAGKPGAGDPAQQASQLQIAAWPGPIVDLLLGKLKPAYAIAFASDPDDDKSVSQRCEAQFYVGEYTLAVEHDSAAALEHLENAKRMCSGISVESLAARMELKRTAPATR